MTSKDELFTLLLEQHRPVTKRESWRGAGYHVAQCSACDGAVWRTIRDAVDAPYACEIWAKAVEAGFVQ